MIIYFKGTRSIFGINLREERKCLQLKGTLTKSCREQWNLLIGDKEENHIFMGLKEHVTLSPPPPEKSSTVKAAKVPSYARA